MIFKNKWTTPYKMYAFKIHTDTNTFLIFTLQRYNDLHVDGWGKCLKKFVKLQVFLYVGM